MKTIEDPFLKEMTKEQRKTYSDCMEARLDIEIAEMRDAFVRGFHMGARLMLETLTEEAAISKSNSSAPLLETCSLNIGFKVKHI